MLPARSRTGAKALGVVLRIGILEAAKSQRKGHDPAKPQSDPHLIRRSYSSQEEAPLEERSNRVVKHISLILVRANFRVEVCRWYFLWTFMRPHESTMSQPNDGRYEQ